jgi:hypothetical protein
LQHNRHLLFTYQVIPVLQGVHLFKFLFSLASPSVKTEGEVPFFGEFLSTKNETDSLLFAVGIDHQGGVKILDGEEWKTQEWKTLTNGLVQQNEMNCIM